MNTAWRARHWVGRGGLSGGQAISQWLCVRRCPPLKGLGLLRCPQDPRALPGARTETGRQACPVREPVIHLGVAPTQEHIDEPGLAQGVVTGHPECSGAGGPHLGCVWPAGPLSSREGRATPWLCTADPTGPLVCCVCTSQILSFPS